jgi:hypothetical protein
VTHATSRVCIDTNQEPLRGGTAPDGIASDGAKASCIAIAFTPIEGRDIDRAERGPGWRLEGRVILSTDQQSHHVDGMTSSVRCQRHTSNQLALRWACV